MNDESEPASNERSLTELERALAMYCDLIDRGDDVDRKTFVANFSAEIRDELTQCLQALDFIRESTLTVPCLDDPDSGDTKSGFRLGDYQIVREIGRGGMGVVYEAVQFPLNRRVAVKVLPFASLLDPRQLERFRNEASAAGRISHPNIVGVLAVGFDRGVHYYSMELIEGCSLADVIEQMRSNGSAPVKRTTKGDTSVAGSLSTERSRNRPAFFRSVATLGAQAASALQVAHDAKIIHRDIKPSNLLIDQDGNLRIADFGLALSHADQEVTLTGNHLLGTLRYMSPEQVVEAHSVDQRADVYSLGVTLYELASGQAVFVGSTKLHLMTDIQNGYAPPLNRVCPDIPRDLATVIGKAMSPHADMRYQTAADFSDDLRSFLGGKPVAARRAGTIEVFARWCLRNRSKAALLGLTTAILLALAVGGPIVAYHQSAVASRQRHEAYDADMAIAHGFIEHGEIDDAVELLRKYLPAVDGEPNDYRSFEWYEMVERCQRRLEAVEARIGWPVRALAVSPDGKEIACGVKTQRIVTW